MDTAEHVSGIQYSWKYGYSESKIDLGIQMFLFSRLRSTF